MNPARKLPWTALSAGLIVILGAFAYLNSLKGPFIYDDLPSIVDNPSIRHLWPLSDVLSPPADGRTVSGRPVLNLSLALNYKWGGTRVAGYHETNLAIHLLAGLALFGIVRRTLLRRSYPPGRSVWLGLAVALLWTLHPLQTEAVTYVVQRAESLMGLFFFLTLYLCLRSTEGEFRAGWTALAVICCALGMGTKEVMVAAPVIAFFYDRTFVAGSARKAWELRKGLYLALFSTEVILAYLVLVSGGGNRNGSMGMGTYVSFWSYFPTQWTAMVHYLKLSAWPHPLIFEYGPFFQTVGQAWICGVMIATLFVGSAIALMRNYAIGFLGLWFLGVLAPTSLVPGASQMIVEHRMYLPLAAVIAFAVVGGAFVVDRAIRGVSARWMSGMAFSGLAFACCAATRARNEDYVSGLALWQDTVDHRPQSAAAQNGLGIELARIPGKSDEAMKRFREALSLKPNFADAHYNLALELSKESGRGTEALAHYREAVQLNPRDPEELAGLANALVQEPGGVTEALGFYERALRLRPDSAESQNNYGRALAAIPGRRAEAIAHYGEALRVAPAYSKAHFNLANALMAEPGNLQGARLHYQEALRSDPNFAEAHDNLGIVCAQLGDVKDAILQFQEAIRLNPGLGDARDHLKALQGPQN